MKILGRLEVTQFGYARLVPSLNHDMTVTLSAHSDRISWRTVFNAIYLFNWIIAAFSAYANHRQDFLVLIVNIVVLLLTIMEYQANCYLQRQVVTHCGVGQNRSLRRRAKEFDTYNRTTRYHANGIFIAPLRSLRALRQIMSAKIIK